MAEKPLRRLKSPGARSGRFSVDRAASAFECLKRYFINIHVAVEFIFLVLMSFRYPSHSPPDPSTIHPTVIVNPRPLAPLYEPPSPHFLPQLPSPTRDPSFNCAYTLTTHLYPSAYPHAPSSPLPPSAYADIPDETKAARVARKKALLHELWMRNVSMVNGAGRREANPKVFWNVVNRFARKNLGGEHEKCVGITLFIAHANGFHKEVCVRIIF